MTNHYAILGVSRDATVEDIRKAYKRLILKCHPDKGGTDAQFIQVQEAYDVLQDANRRATFDREYFAQSQFQPQQAQDAWNYRDSTAGSAYRSYRGHSANVTSKGTSESCNSGPSRPKSGFGSNQSNFHQPSDASRSGDTGSSKPNFGFGSDDYIFASCSFEAYKASSSGGAGPSQTSSGFGTNQQGTGTSTPTSGFGSNQSNFFQGPDASNSWGTGQSKPNSGFGCNSNQWDTGPSKPTTGFGSSTGFGSNTGFGSYQPHTGTSNPSSGFGAGSTQWRFPRPSGASSSWGSGSSKPTSGFGSNQQNSYQASSFEAKFFEQRNTNAGKARMNHFNFTNGALLEMMHFSQSSRRRYDPSLDKNLEAKLHEFADRLKRREEQVYSRGHKPKDIQETLARWDVGNIDYDTANINKLDQLAAELVDAGEDLLDMKDGPASRGRIDYARRNQKWKVWLDMSAQIDYLMTDVLEGMREEATSTEEWEEWQKIT